MNLNNIFAQDNVAKRLLCEIKKQSEMLNRLEDSAICLDFFMMTDELISQIDKKVKEF